LLALTDFLELFGKQNALASGLPPHLQQSAIEVAQSAHNRHLFAGKMNLAATWISHPFRQSCSSHDGFLRLISPTLDSSFKAGNQEAHFVRTTLTLDV